MQYYVTALLAAEHRAECERAAQRSRQARAAGVHRSPRRPRWHRLHRRRRPLRIIELDRSIKRQRVGPALRLPGTWS